MLAALVAILLISIIIKIVIDYQIQRLRVENNENIIKNKMSPQVREVLGGRATNYAAHRAAKTLTSDDRY